MAARLALQQSDWNSAPRDHQVPTLVPEQGSSGCAGRVHGGAVSFSQLPRVKNSPERTQLIPTKYMHGHGPHHANDDVPPFCMIAVSYSLPSPHCSVMLALRKAI